MIAPISTVVGDNRCSMSTLLSCACLHRCNAFALVSILVAVEEIELRFSRCFAVENVLHCSRSVTQFVFWFVTLTVCVCVPQPVRFIYGSDLLFNARCTVVLHISYCFPSTLAAC